MNGSPNIDALNGRVLLIDDSPDESRLSRLHLEKEGFTVQCVDTLSSARDELSKRTTDLVLLDLRFRNGSGLEMLQWLRNQFHAAMPPVIVVTVSGDHDEHIRALEFGAEDVLRKPLDFNELSAKVRVHLEVKLLRDELEAQNHRLEDTAAKLENTLALRRQFLGLITHDLRTPITTIKLAAEVLRDNLSQGFLATTEGQRFQDLLQVLLRNTIRVETNFREIMTIARLNSDALQLSPGPLDLNSVARDALAGVGDQENNTLPKINLDLGAIPPMTSDVRLIHQLIANLLNTSLSRMDMTNHTTLKTQVSGEHVLISVTDNGPYLTPEFVSELMEGLNSNAPTPQTRVTLYSACRIAQAHGGTFQVSSDPQAGTCFEATIPLHYSIPQ